MQLEPNDALALSSRGDVKRMQGDYAGAIADLDRSLQLEPNDALALSSRGDVKRMQGDYAGAIADFDSSLQLQPKCAFAVWLCRTRTLMVWQLLRILVWLWLLPFGDNADLDSMLKPLDAWALRWRGEAKRMQGDYVGAIADLDLSLQLQPNDALALRGRGDAKRKRGDYVGAVADFDSVLQLNPKDAFILKLRGDAKRMLGDYVGAIADLDLSLQLQPNDALALRGRGEAKREQGDYVGAIADLVRSLQLEPNNAFALSSRGAAKKTESSRWFVERVDNLFPLHSCRISEQQKWAIVGAGPVGLTLALSLAEAMDGRGLGQHVASVDIYESRWIQPFGEVWSRNLAELFSQKSHLRPTCFNLGYVSDCVHRAAHCRK